MSREKKPGFEEEIERLESIVNRLEDGGLPLEESLELFEEGQKLLNRCRERLDKAQVKVHRLLESGEIKPVDPENLGTADGQDG